MHFLFALPPLLARIGVFPISFPMLFNACLSSEVDNKDATLQAPVNLIGSAVAQCEDFTLKIPTTAKRTKNTRTPTTNLHRPFSVSDSSRFWWRRSFPFFVNLTSG